MAPAQLVSPRRQGESRRESPNWRAPGGSVEDIERSPSGAFAACRTASKLCEGLIIHVVDFPDEETLEEMNAETEFDLLGLFRGRGLAHRRDRETGALPNMVWLYRRPLLDFWCEGEETLERW